MAGVDGERFKRCTELSYNNYPRATEFHCDNSRQQRSKRLRISLASNYRKSFPVWSLYLIIFSFAMLLPGAEPKELQSLLCKYLRYIDECDSKVAASLQSIPPNSTHCPGGFDGFICWPHGPPEQVVPQPCPNYLDYVKENSTAHRFCLANGSWHRRPTDDGGWEIWDHRTECKPLKKDELDAESVQAKQELAMLTGLGITYTVGYAVSLVCLVIALVLFTYFRKLHCMRNYIHMNLMISFILRYTTVLIKDRVVQAHYDPARFDSLNQEEMKLFCDEFGGVSGYMISCRMVITLMHYAILANYFWLLAEGIYLQILLSFPLTDCKENNYFSLFMAGGWGAPWIPVGVWVALRITLENVGCWEMYENPNIWWCLRAPVIATIAINFIIFINIIRIIIIKLRAHNLKRNDYKMTLAKSTLALIPLLGIHYIVFLAITDDEVESMNVVMKVKIAFEMVLTSLQGMLIAVFYCFLNGEVRGEVVKFWKNLRLKNGLPSNTFRKTSTYNSNGTQLTTAMMYNSEDKSQMLQETSLLTPNNRCDSGKSSRRSTMTNNDLKVPPASDGSNCSLITNNKSSRLSANVGEDTV